jgi:hypothetical protein
VAGDKNQIAPFWQEKNVICQAKTLSAPLFYSCLFFDNNRSQFYKWLFDNFSTDERIK